MGNLIEKIRRGGTALRLQLKDTNCIIGYTTLANCFGFIHVFLSTKFIPKHWDPKSKPNKKALEKAFSLAC
jgi:hypothetical protein